MNQKDVGNKIAQRRKQLGMTQSMLAEKLQVTNKAISKWETGEGYPDITLLKKISMCLEMSCDELLADQEVSKESVEKGVRQDVKSVLTHSMIVLTFFLPFVRYEGYTLGNEVFPNITYSLTGFQLMTYQISSIQTAFVTAGLILLVLTSLLKVMFYSNIFSNIVDYSVITNKRMLYFTGILCNFTLIIVGISTYAHGPQIGYMLLVILWILGLVYDSSFRTKRKSLTF